MNLFGLKSIRIFTHRTCIYRKSANDVHDGVTQDELDVFLRVVTDGYLFTLDSWGTCGSYLNPDASPQHHPLSWKLYGLDGHE